MQFFEAERHLAVTREFVTPTSIKRGDPFQQPMQARWFFKCFAIVVSLKPLEIPTLALPPG
jgi:hypothetical protein